MAGWLARHERRVRPSTFEREAQSLRRFEVLSRFYVEEVTAARVEEIVMAGGSRQAQIALRLVKRVLADARSRGQRVHEPVFAIEPPRHESRDPRFLTWTEVEELARRIVATTTTIMTMARVPPASSLACARVRAIEMWAFATGAS